jgi:hypothetical protein
MPNRLRLKIPDRKGDRGYFRRLVEVFSKDKSYKRIQANPMTGGVLFEGASIDLDRVLNRAEQNDLFVLKQEEKTTSALAQVVTAPLGRLNRMLNQSTSSQFDLATIIFLALLGTGIVQIMRGNFRAPPWYTAFWYAFGVFSKSLADTSGE